MLGACLFINVTVTRLRHCTSVHASNMQMEHLITTICTRNHFKQVWSTTTLFLALLPIGSGLLVRSALGFDKHKAISPRHWYTC